MNLKISGIQMGVGTDVRLNCLTICSALRRAAAEGADILLTPEGSLSGYTPHFDQAEVAEAMRTLVCLTRELGVGMALGTCFKESDGLTYNQIRFYSGSGDFLGFHSKILRCGSLSDPSIGEINDYATTPLQIFQFKGVTIGGLICNDMWANPSCTLSPDPFLSQRLSNLGAKVIFHAVNGDREGSAWDEEVGRNFHESNLRMRASAGRVWIVTVDNGFPLCLPPSSPAGVLDPSGNWVRKVSGCGEQFFTHEIPVEG